MKFRFVWIAKNGNKYFGKWADASKVSVKALSSREGLDTMNKTFGNWYLEYK